MIITMDSMRGVICKNFNRIADERSDLSVPEIAAAAGVTRGMVYKWKSGENIPDVDKLDLLAKLFRVDVMEFYSQGTIMTSLYPSRQLKKYLVIPDEIVNLAAELSDDHDEVWRDIEKELKARIIERSIKQKA